MRPFRPFRLSSVVSVWLRGGSFISLLIEENLSQPEVGLAERSFGVSPCCRSKFTCQQYPCANHRQLPWEATVRGCS